ncbi:protein FAM210A-like isoform X2 [Nomia melanderi]|uniref:protein FAM210A-like isoform X2 n=1 Tax=Nomia melanderi TaxID=2448451 RepID=UPI003FCE497A
MEVILHRRLISTLGLGSLYTTKNILASVRCLQCTDPKRWMLRLSDKHLHYRNSSRNSVLFFNHITVNKLPYKYNVTKCSIPVANYCSKQTGKQVPENSCKPQNVSLLTRMKEMAKDYWHILIPVHLVTTAGWVIIFYIMVKNGVNIETLLEFLHVHQKYIDMAKNSDAGNWALTYGLFKIFTPFRYALTLGITTMTIKHLRNSGLVKPFPFSELLRIFAKPTTDALNRKIE